MITCLDTTYSGSSNTNSESDVLCTLANSNPLQYGYSYPAQITPPVFPPNPLRNKTKSKPRQGDTLDNLRRAFSPVENLASLLFRSLDWSVCAEVFIAKNFADAKKNGITSPSDLVVFAQKKLKNRRHKPFEPYQTWEGGGHGKQITINDETRNMASKEAS